MISSACFFHSGRELAKITARIFGISAPALLSKFYKLAAAYFQHLRSLKNVLLFRHSLFLFVCNLSGP